MIRLAYFLVSLLVAFAASAAPVSKTDFGPVVIFDPPTNYTAQRTLYARSLLLTVSPVVSPASLSETDGETSLSLTP
jgi:hypothetical protein